MIDISPHDVALRDQMFYEQVRAYEADKADDVTNEMIVSIAAILAALGITSFVGMTKKTLDELIRRLAIALSGILARSNVAIIKSLKAALAAVLTVGKSNNILITGKRIANAVIAAAIGNKTKLWKEAAGDIIPGTGLTPIELIGDFSRAVLTQTKLAVKKAWASKSPLSEFLALIKGTPAKGFKDGLARKFNNQYRAASDTMLQYIKQWVMNKLGPLWFDRYQWISTLDSVTTEYCRAHHLRIYEYGRGPIPPAHYRCRSTIVGIRDATTNNTPGGFAEWFKTQPKKFIAAITGRKAISPEEYIKRLPFMQISEE